MKRICLSLIALILFSTPFFSQTFDCFADDSQNSKKTLLSDKDKAQIIKSVLQEFDFLNRYIYEDEKKEVVYLSTKNIPPKFVPTVSGINFVLLKPEEIEEKIKNGFGYFVFSKIGE